MTKQRTECRKTVTGEMDGVKVEVSLTGYPEDVEEIAWQFKVMLNKLSHEASEEK